MGAVWPIPAHMDEAPEVRWGEGDTSWGYSEHNQLSPEYFMGHNLQSGIKDLNYNVRI